MSLKTWLWRQPFDEPPKKSFQYLMADWQDVRLLPKRLLDPFAINFFSVNSMNYIWQVYCYTFQVLIFASLSNTVKDSLWQTTAKISSVLIFKDFAENSTTLRQEPFSIAKLVPLATNFWTSSWITWTVTRQVSPIPPIQNIFVYHFWSTPLCWRRNRKKYHSIYW